MSGLRRENFRMDVAGKKVDLFTLKNHVGMEIGITNYGGRIVSWMVPDRYGALQDVVLGFDHIQDYKSKPSSFGATVGRFANRIDNGKFVLDGDTIVLDLNNGKHSIHGGALGWQNQVFDAEQLSDSELILRYISEDGEGGFPGTVKVKVTFNLSDDNELQIDYFAETDKKTVINMTNHSFFNLSGRADQNILGHILYIDANTYTPLREDLITTGEYDLVDGTPFDFRIPISIGHALEKDTGNQQLQLTKGFDHNLVVNNQSQLGKAVAKLYSPVTGISLSIYSTEPGIQVYSGNMLDGSRTGKREIVYHTQSGICLEPQRYPDSPNKPHWPSTTLQPGQPYRSTTIYRFDCELIVVE